MLTLYTYIQNFTISPIEDVKMYHINYYNVEATPRATCGSEAENGL